MTKPVRGALMTLAVIGIAAGVTIGLQARHAGATSLNDPSLGFRDQSSGAYLRIDASPADAGAGQFYFTAPGVGLVRPATAATLVPHSAQDEQFRYDGAGTLFASAVLDSDTAQPVPAGTSSPATVRVVGHIDPAHQTATVEVWINGQHFTLNAAPAPHNAANTVTAVINAVKATDLGALYDLGDPSLRGGLTRAQFITQVSATGSGSVTSVTVTGATTYVTTSAGADFALTPITLAYTSNGTPATVQAHIRLIYTGGQWRYMTMQPDSTPANYDDNTPDPSVS
jgi:hypothetical protein